MNVYLPTHMDVQKEASMSKSKSSPTDVFPEGLLVAFEDLSEAAEISGFITGRGLWFELWPVGIESEVWKLPDFVGFEGVGKALAKCLGKATFLFQ